MSQVSKLLLLAIVMLSLLSSCAPTASEKGEESIRLLETSNKFAQEANTAADPAEKRHLTNQAFAYFLVACEMADQDPELAGAADREAKCASVSTRVKGFAESDQVDIEETMTHLRASTSN